MAQFSFLNVWLCACLSGIATSAAAQQDTTQHQLRTVEVFGKPAEVFAAGSRVVQVDSTFLSTYSSSSLAEALQARSPIYFKSYGASGISSVSFRGTNASQTAVLWNGLNISPATLGLTDFSTLPLSGLGEVALQHGSAAAMYGSGAIGGAVLLNSPKYKTRGLGGDVKLEAGSFGRYFGSGSIGYSGRKFSYGLSAYGHITENNFKFKDLSRYKAPEVREEHAAVEQRGFTQDLRWHLSPKTEVAVHGWYTFSDRELQPAMGSANTNSRQLDESLRLMAELQHQSQLGQTSVKAAFFNDYLHFTDLSNNSKAEVGTYQLQAEQTYTHGARWSLRGGVNLQRFVAENDGYEAQADENRAALFALFRYDPVQPLQLTLNLRQALVEGFNPPPTPALGFNWKFFNSNRHQVSLKGNTSGSYRVPTLNDRFWVGAGNPELRPEQGWNHELGLRHVLVQGNTLLLQTEATAYYMLVDDWIQWAPGAGDVWRPTNLHKVESKGVEVSTTATATLAGVKLNSTAAYTYTSSEQVEVYEGSGDKGKQLMYVPRHKAIFSTEAAYRNWTLLGNLNYTGLRYTSNSETTSLDSFLLLHLALTRKLQLGQNSLLLTLRSDNVTNAAYQTMVSRAMPPRGYTFSIRFIIP
ncbi:TonB-dependent receptor plug domain-containing protein [Pontibacter actiniarum]|uniref:TonB dependent receptor n=1 Tax=Pontibacter actiniarum TaxID=323450 RepID=A0A1X9YWQ1_9BACT|nr:TonB-dependent receptor plug domain-containing protein [Pontibacter actiniarum]ARS37366.1 TonB dependent receptor [Pontibacter actiniarum]